MRGFLCKYCSHTLKRELLFTTRHWGNCKTLGGMRGFMDFPLIIQVAGDEINSPANMKITILSFNFFSLETLAACHQRNWAHSLCNLLSGPCSWRWNLLSRASRRARFSFSIYFISIQEWLAWKIILIIEETGASHQIRFGVCLLNASASLVPRNYYLCLSVFKHLWRDGGES